MSGFVGSVNGISEFLTATQGCLIMKNSMKLLFGSTFILGLISCVSPNLNSKLKTNHVNEKEPYSTNKHFVTSPVKFEDQQELDSHGNTFPTAASGLRGRFYFKEGCLKFVSEFSRNEATPIFNYNLVSWNPNNQTLRLYDTIVGMGQLIEGSGEFGTTSNDNKGRCWIENTVYVGSIGVKILESSL